ncbi:hypothetical protein Sjap_023775 [Stephania japonica]|uniref:Uncharacterized protein n=1 Tax=Stephania japonica TaxID=461633 RepID=A0AAP0HJ98_9MAGN
MGGGEAARLPFEEVIGGALARVRVVEAPILLLVLFHRALRAELAELHRISAACAEEGRGGGDLVGELDRRFRFLKVVYKYHCAAEDEVIFQALDQRIGNISCTYSLEHGDIDELFDSVFQSLNVLLNGDDKVSSFQLLMLYTGTIHMSICQHMLKEEQQVFPLLIQHFSFKEQALLVWQFICSVPVTLLEEFLPWMTSYLPDHEQLDVVNCLKVVIPKEKLLQEVVISWLGKRNQNILRVLRTEGNEKASLNEPFNFKELQKSCSSWKSSHGKSLTLSKFYCSQDNGNRHPVDSLLLWHSAIKKDFNQILLELNEIRSSKILSSLALVTGQIKFLVDVLIFYSDALEKVFLSLLNKISDCNLSLSNQRFPEEGQIGSLLSVLQKISFPNEMPLSKLVERLCWHLESFVVEMIKHFSFQESEVFPLIRNHCNRATQLHLLYESLHMMPLGLLKCFITWLSAHLTEDESKDVLGSIKLAGSEADVCFASLLHEWVCIGYSGKSSMEKFREELQGIFRSRNSFLSEQINQSTEQCLEPNIQHSQVPHLCQIKHNSVDKAESSTCDFSSQNTEEQCSTLYSSGINLQIYFPEILKKISFSEHRVKKCDAGSSLGPAFNPIDHIFLFHKALRNDLEHLVHVSAKMIENVGFAKDFLQRFQLLRFLYKIHSETEDEIAFPALEAKQEFQNISHSYSVDHKLELEYFDNISRILDEMSKLDIPFDLSASVDATMSQTMLKYRQLCMKLHCMCKTMCIALVNHIHREEVELWPLFTKCLSNDEQEKIIGCILGRTRAEALREMIPWLMASLSAAEQNSILSLWLKTTKNTMFDAWLAEWWEGMNRRDTAAVEDESKFLSTGAADPLDIVLTYLSREAYDEPTGKVLHDKGLTHLLQEPFGCHLESHGNGIEDDHKIPFNGDMGNNQHLEDIKCPDKDTQPGTEKILEVKDQVDKPGEVFSIFKKAKQQEELVLTLRQEDLEAAVRRVSRDTSLDPKKKSYIIQNLLMSRWLVTQQMPRQESPSADGEIPDIAMMMLYDDEREIYHCPYCNLCRVGKGLGVDYFHCMNCNACMAKSLSLHVCREKGFESNCPICHEDIFTSCSPVKALPCGHMMHSTCFQDYTCSHYICPICSKSLGDMQLYFGMLDVLLAEEKTPQEYHGQTQMILCNDSVWEREREREREREKEEGKD